MIAKNGFDLLLAVNEVKVTQLWCNSNSTCRATYWKYIPSFKLISQSMLKESPENADGRTDGWTDGRTDGHCHGIIRPFFKRAYNKRSLSSPYPSHKGTINHHADSTVAMASHETYCLAYAGHITPLEKWCHSFIHSFARSYVRSFVRLFMQSSIFSIITQPIRNPLHSCKIRINWTPLNSIKKMEWISMVYNK